MSIVKKLSIATVGAVLVAFGTIQKSEAITLLNDNFNNETTGLGLTNLTNFNATANPNVDVIGEGTPFFSFTSNGRYVDLDGSNRPDSDGTLVSNQSFNLTPDNVYTLSFDLAGNPATSSPNSVEVTLGSFTQTITLPSGSQNTSFSPFTFSFAGTNTDSFLAFNSLSANDGSGLYLDNVSLESAAVPFELSPALGSLALVAWGVGIGLQRKLKTNPELLSRIMVK